MKKILGAVTSDGSNLLVKNELLEDLVGKVFGSVGTDSSGLN